jgi:hypothetical protein
VSSLAGNTNWNLLACLRTSGSTCERSDGPASRCTHTTPANMLIENETYCMARAGSLSAMTAVSPRWCPVLIDGLIARLEIAGIAQRVGASQA